MQCAAVRTRELSIRAPLQYLALPSAPTYSSLPTELWVGVAEPPRTQHKHHDAVQ